MSRHDSPSLKEDLLRPEAYASAARTQSVALIETHISWVFVLDNDVFKVKKPVNMGFLDFSSKEQRHAACEAEIQLNRRLSPCVYLGVVPIHRGDDGRACIGGSGPVIDWAVRMVRLPDDERADVRLDAGVLTPSAMDAIAQRLARFHAVCRSDEETAHFGSPAALTRNVEENFAQTKDLLDKYLAQEEADELLRWQRSFLLEHAAVFEQRAARGYVRDGHGDLRLEHVYFDGGVVTVLDCIEFNERFRFVDVASDAAFLAMDLAGHGRVDLAERFLATYVHETNDFDLYTVIDFYESYRAFVRGKISALMAEDVRIDETTRRKAARDARRHFLLALSADRRSLLSPEVVAVGGLMASGKSTVAHRISEELNAPIVNADRTRKELLGVDPGSRIDERPWTGAYDPAVTAAVYREVFRRAATILDSGRPVVIDASFRSCSTRAAARELATRRVVPFRFVECQAPAGVCKTRLVEREHVRIESDARLHLFDTFRDRFEPIHELKPGDHIVVDTTKPVEMNLETLRNRLDVWPGATMH